LTEDEGIDVVIKTEGVVLSFTFVCVIELETVIPVIVIVALEMDNDDAIELI